MHEMIISSFASICYRLALFTLGAVYVSSNSNTIPTNAYYLIFIIYISSYFFFIQNREKTSSYRLIVDYIFIFLVTYNFNKSIVAYTLLLLPIINSPNHTTKRKSFFFIYTIPLGILLYHDILSHSYSDAANSFLCIAFIWSLGILSIIKEAFKKLDTDLNDIIYETKSNITSITEAKKLYKNFIEKYNSKFKYIFPGITEIYCLKIQKGTLKIVNSSSFIKKIEPINIYDRLTLLEKEKVFNDTAIIVDDRQSESNIAAYIESEQNKFLFIIEKDQNTKGKIPHYIVIRALYPVLLRISKVIDAELLVEKEKWQYLQKLRKNLGYIESARLAMHFLRNKFTPIDNFIEMCESMAEISPDDELLKLLADERNEAKKSLSSIIDKTSELLEKQKKIHFKPNKTINISELYEIVRKAWDEVFHEDILEIDIPPNSFDDKVKINSDGLSLSLADIITNIKKYNNGEYGLSLHEKDNLIILYFFNNTKNDTNNNSSLATIVEEFMSDSTREIAARKTHGLEFIRKVLDHMEFDYSARLENDIFILEISINIIRKEEDD